MGITWLELYIVYRVKGHPKPIPDPSPKAQLKATAAKQIQAFKKAVRGNVARTLINSDDAQLFRPAKAQIDTLKGVGIQGKHATLSLNIAVTPKERVDIAHALVRLNGPCAASKPKNLLTIPKTLPLIRSK